jgi:acyl dehydratase
MTATLAALNKGHAFDPTELSLTQEWVTAYTAAVEDAAIGSFPGVVPPMGIAALTIRALLSRAALPDGAIHLGQELSFRRPVSAGEDLIVGAAIANRSERSGWALLVIGTDVRDSSGGAVLEGRSTLTFPLTGGTIDVPPDEAHGDGSEPGSPPRVQKQLTQANIDAYADASGDHNPLHVDPEFAAQTRFGGTIAHGMLVLAYLSEMMTMTCGEKWLSSGRLKVRFRAPARPGDVVSGYSVARGSVWDVEARNGAGRVLISGQAGVAA